MVDRPRRNAGYTLIELVVVITIIGIVAAFGYPRYTRLVESSRADQARVITEEIANANRMYALDHGGQYAGAFHGTFYEFTNICRAFCCADTPGCATSAANGCNLISCKYLANRDWDSLPYVFRADFPSVDACYGYAAGDYVACSRRRAGSGAPAPYSDWGYGVNASGVLTHFSLTSDLPPAAD